MLRKFGEVAHAIIAMGLQCIEIKSPDPGRPAYNPPIASRIFARPSGDDVQITRCSMAGALEASVFGFMRAWINMPPE